MARLYAATYPDEVVGLVLVDPAAEQLESELGPRQWQALLQFTVDAAGFNTVYLIPGYGDVETIDFGTFNSVMRQAASASPLRPMPLAVLSHGQTLRRYRGTAGVPSRHL